MIIGHQKQKKYFKNLVSGGSLGHAYLFSGPEMIGKKTFAVELSQMILGDNFETNPDFKIIAPKIEEGESKIYIEDVRDLKKIFSVRSYGNNYRIVVVDDAHRLTQEAANAFLKLLEEPPAGSVIILVSSMADTLPSTILSRCEEVRFSAPDDREISEYLSTLRGLNKEDREFLVKLARGRIGLIKTLTDNSGIVAAKKIIDDLRTLLNKGMFERIEYAKKIHDNDKYAETVAGWLYWVSAHLVNSPKNEKIVKNLLHLNKIISQPQFNHRLALENFLLNL